MYIFRGSTIPVKALPPKVTGRQAVFPISGRCS
jgi:hypothetical protein